MQFLLLQGDNASKTLNKEKMILCYTYVWQLIIFLVKNTHIEISPAKKLQIFLPQLHCALHYIHFKWNAINTTVA